MNDYTSANLPVPPKGWPKLQRPSATSPAPMANESQNPSPQAGFLQTPSPQAGLSEATFPQPVPQLPASQQPAHPHAASPQPPFPQNAAPATAGSKKREGAEVWLGKYAASAIAALLVFIGLAMLGHTVLPQLSDAVRIAVMFSVSGSLFVVGSLLELHKSNGLTLALLSCGAASLLSSLWAVDLLMGLEQETIAILIVLALMAARLLLGARRHNQADEGASEASPVTADSHYRFIVLAFTSLVAAYECLFGFWFMSFEEGDLVAAIAGACCLFALVGVGALLLWLMKPSSPGIVAFAVACTMLLMSYLHNCTPLVVEGYTWSACCVVCALVCAAIGFAMKLGGLRLYGLVLMMACVVKLTMFDTGELGSIERSAAFVVAGLVCFGISALYHYAVKCLPVE